LKNLKICPHPLPVHKRNLYLLFFLLYLPFIFSSLILMITHCQKAKLVTDVADSLWIYLISNLIINIILIILRFSLKLSYQKKLRMRTRSLENFVDAINRQYFQNYLIQAEVGELGAWIEVKFSGEGMQMIDGDKKGVEESFGGEEFRIEIEGIEAPSSPNLNFHSLTGNQGGSDETGELNLMNLEKKDSWEEVDKN